MRRVFFDANVLIAGVASHRGASRAALMMAEAGLFQMVVSRQVLDEAERNLRRKLPRGLPILVEILGHVHLEVVDDPAPQSFARWLDCIEAKDAPIVETAVSANIDSLLTLNSRDFTPGVAARSGLTILAPAQFVERLREIVTEGL